MNQILMDWLPKEIERQMHMLSYEHSSQLWQLTTRCPVNSAGQEVDDVLFGRPKYLFCCLRDLGWKLQEDESY